MTIMSIFAPIEKLITEHGSADIQTKHIAFLKEQFTALERENVKLAEKVVFLENENIALKNDKEILEKSNSMKDKEIEALKKEIRNIKEKPINKNDRYLKQEQEDILKLINDNQEINHLKLLVLTKQKPQSFKFHIDTLLNFGFIIGSPKYSSFMDRNPIYSYTITHDGQKYLDKNELL